MDQRSLFKPRQLAPTPSNETTNAAKTTELTKNQYYCVSVLPSRPSVLKESFDSLNGYADHLSNYALVVGEKTLNVWRYTSTDPVPLLIQFPVLNVLPLAILTTPTLADDPGILIIDSASGQMKFYESVQHAPALGLITNRLLEAQVSLATDEYITLAENVEPAGVAIATSKGRCALISLRDYSNKPSLKVIELPFSGSRGLLNFSLFSSVGSSRGEIVSIKTVETANELQLIAVVDVSGNFNLITLQQSTESIYVVKSESFSQLILPQIGQNLEGFATLDLKVVDLWPMTSAPSPLIYLALVTVGSKELALVTLRVEKSGVLTYGTHKLHQANLEHLLTIKPKLYLPAPHKTAFVVLGSQIVLTDVDISYIETQNTNAYYTPRWEDTVRLKSNINVIGTGYEDQSNTSNPSVILISTDLGILRVERFASAPDQPVKSLLKLPESIVKSHIEQAIYFSENAAIDFDFSGPGSYDPTVIENAVLQVRDEIMDSSSPYLPDFLPSVTDFLTQKVQLFIKLIDYVKRNFGNDLVSAVVEGLEKTSVALNLWEILQENSQCNDIFQEVLAPESARDFFSSNIKDINYKFTSFIEKFVQQNDNLSSLVPILVSTLYNGIYQNEVHFIDESMPPSKSWVYETDLIVKYEEIYRKAFLSPSSEVIKLGEDKQNAIKLCQLLYYLVNGAIKYMRESGELTQLKEYLKWFKLSKKQWISILLNRGLNQEALEIAENYCDLSSLASILEHRRETESFGGELQQLFDHYFEKFGYNFALNWYDSLIENDQIQRLLVEFPEHRHYLSRYFKENPNKTTQFSWIRDFLDGKFESGANALAESVIRERNLDNRELKFSLAKLADIAASGETGTKNGTYSVDNSGFDDGIEIIRRDEQLAGFNAQLAQIRIQKLLYKDLSIGESILGAEYISNNFVNENVTPEVFKTECLEALTNFVQQQSMEPEQLISLLTMIKPTSITGKKGFGYALRIASLLKNESVFVHQTRLIWLRLLGLTDDWSQLSQVDLVKDGAVKLRIENSSLYRTFEQIGPDLDDFTQHLEYVLNNTKNVEDETNAQRRVLEYLQKNELKKWVHTVQEQIRNL